LVEEGRSSCNCIATVNPHGPLPHIAIAIFDY
jgi:hypothetical protein